MKCLGSVHALRLRVAALDANGVPTPGANQLYVTDQLVRIRFSPEYETGTEIVQKNGAGVVCFSHKAADSLKRINVLVELCRPDPALTSLLAGGSTITEDGEVIGWAAPRVGSEPNPDGVSLEAWSRTVVGSGADPDYPYMRWVFPRVKLRIPNERELAEAALATILEGEGEENENFHDGPANDWPFTSDSSYQYAYETDLPDAVCGFQTLVAS